MKPTLLSEVASKMKLFTRSRSLVKGVSVDSRKTRPGDIFFALPGATADGHNFISEAVHCGAKCAVVKSGYSGQDFGIPLLYCDDVLEAFQTLAKESLKSSKINVIGITGSLGKTTTKEFIVALLRKNLRVSCSPGNSNSQIGLPLTILNHTCFDDDILILEMGMTEKGQLSKLIDIAPPKIAVVTKVALVHASNFNSIEDIAHSKAEIFKHPQTKLGIFDLDSNLNESLKNSGGCEKISFSTSSSDADFYLKLKEDKMLIKSQSDQAVLPLLALPGAHNRHNFLAAIAVARTLGIGWEEIEEAQKNLHLPERRLQIVTKFDALFINDAYNASEMSIKAALDSLPQAVQGAKRIAVLGGIVELGKFSEECHRAVGEYALNYIDLMFCYGEEALPILECWQEANRPVVWAKERAGIIGELRSQLKKGDIVLLKGSFSKGVWKVLDEL